MKRFDSITYDEASLALLEEFKTKFMEIDELTNKLLDGRSRALVHTQIETAFMWVGKAIRDDQDIKNQIEKRLAVGQPQINPQLNP